MYMHNPAMGNPGMQPMGPGMGMAGPGMGMGGPGMGMAGPGMGMAGPGMGMGMGGPGIGPGGQLVWDPAHFSVEQIWSFINGGIYIKQKFDILEAMTGCETANKYYVHELNNSGEAKKKKIFKCKEKSGWCARNCMAPDCKPFNMEVKKCAKDEDFDTDETVILMERECQCTCYCFNRPEMKIYLTQGGQKNYLGKVVDNYDFCNYSYSVYDTNDKIVFFIKASCCQCGFHCKCPCEACEKIQFDLWRGDKEKEEAPIMKIGKKGCLKNLISDADNFSVPFPLNATWQEKTLLLGAVLMIDFMQFEEKGGNQGSQGLH